MENIGNPTPSVGVHWIRENELASCAVDGKVPNPYIIDSHFLSNGYIASGPPNSKSDSNSLKFDGTNDYVSMNNISLYSDGFTIEFWLKRDSLNRIDAIISHGANNSGVEILFTADNKLYFNIQGLGGVYSPTYTDTEWHKWICKYSTYQSAFGRYRSGCSIYNAAAYGFQLNIYRDNARVATQSHPGLLSNYSSADCFVGLVPELRSFQRCYPTLYNCGKWWPCMKTVCTPVYYYSYRGIFDKRWGNTVITHKLYSTANNTLLVGKSHSTAYLKGELKDLKIYNDKNFWEYTRNGWKIIRSNKVVDRWLFTEKKKSAVAKNVVTTRNGTLYNFDTDTCWVVDPTIKVKYEFSDVSDRQELPEFKMNAQATITYQWDKQLLISMNSTPQNIEGVSYINVTDDSGQSNQEGSGTWQYKGGTNLELSADHWKCLLLQGYKDNITLETFTSDTKVINNLKDPVNITWQYEPYVFEETVNVGEYVTFATVPDDIRQLIMKTKKPVFIKDSDQPELNESNFYIWNNFEGKLYPIRGDVSFEVKWDLSQECSNFTVIGKIHVKWPVTSHVIHVAETPPVPIDPFPNDNIAFTGLKFAEVDGNVSAKNEFSANKKGKSVLSFTRTVPKEVDLKDIYLHFDGISDHIDLKKNIALARDAFTVEFWAKRQTLNKNHIIVSQGGPFEEEELNIGFNADNTFTFGFTREQLNTSEAYSDTEWHHWACVYERINEDSSNYFICINNSDNAGCEWWNPSVYTKDIYGKIVYNVGDIHWDPNYYSQRCRSTTTVKYKQRIYRDGELVQEQEIDRPYQGKGSLYLGTTAKLIENTSFQGDIDELRIWSKARTEAEIKESKDKSLNGDEESLLGYWNLDDVYAPYITDKTNHVNNGTMVFMDPSIAWVVNKTSEKAKGNLNDERSLVLVVETRPWQEDKRTDEAIIGTELTSNFHDENVPHNGYVFWENARYNPDIYDRSTMDGPIYPVNQHYTNKIEDNIMVVWYQTQYAISWPYQPIEYSCKWPTDNRVVIASRVGSEGKDNEGTDQMIPDKNGDPQNYYDPARYVDIKMYHQPNPEKAGYNPNEEHGLVAPSFRHADAAPRPYAGFALRNELNVKTHDANYTSDPYLLVQYFDKMLGKHGMKAYKVEKDDPSVGYIFSYPMKAGDPIVAPYPVNIVIGATPPEEIFGKNGTYDQTCYFLDHKGTGWAVSGDTHIFSYFWYPLAPDFWCNGDLQCDENLAIGDGTGDVGKPIPWLPINTVSAQDQFPPDMTGRPKVVEVRYDVTWPEDVPILKAGESLTFPGGEYRADNPTYPGLPGVLGWAAGQVVFDSLNPKMSVDKLNAYYQVRLMPALLERTVDLKLANYPEDLKPAGKRVDVVGTRWYFKELHAGLKTRIFYDSINEKLGIRGFINGKTLGDNGLTASPPAVYVLQSNVMTDRERDTIKDITGADVHFKAAVDNLYAHSRNPNNLGLPYSVGLQTYNTILNDMLSAHPKEKKLIDDMFFSYIGNDVNDRPIQDISLGPGLAVVPNGRFLNPTDSILASFTQGYVTLVENNHPDLGALPVSLHIIKVVKEKYRGAIKTVFSENVFDEKITLRHSADFGGECNDLVFQWWYREEDGADQPPPIVKPEKWKIFPDISGKNGIGMAEISMAGAGAALLVDNLFFVRYRHINADPNSAASWSNLAGAANSRPPNLNEDPADTYQAQLAEGWIKRVLNAVNPFEARIKNFYNIDNPATYVSMIQQAGSRFEGDVPFNPQKDVIENVGLIELYQTVLNRASDLSINLDQPASTSGVVTALLLAASRISGFYNLLGSEAYTDSLDPTIGFGSDSVEYGSLAPTIHSFMNQVPDLLEEELALLRGKSEEGARPAYNRLMWNFTKDQGEAAYALSYNIQDTNKDGFIDVEDGRTLFPQGHGDAWGHYLTSLKGYYELLGHPYFNWESRSELFSIQGVVMDVDYFDERKFTEAAAAKAKIGTEIVNLTYRSKYVENPEGQWQGYKDTDPKRAWGVTGWGRRTFQGAYFDWVMANAILPSYETFRLSREDIDRIKEKVPFAVYTDLNNIENLGYPNQEAFLEALEQTIGHDQTIDYQEIILNFAANEGLKRVDRTTVQDIPEIASEARHVQDQFDNVNTGLNPLGLASGVVPFDIDPSRLVPGAVNAATYFEQIYERVTEIMDNTRVIFDHANDLKNRIRQIATSTEEFTDQTLKEDRVFRNRLIEIFGTPYEGTIGPGKTYPPGYKGPDYYFYNYIDVNEVSEETVVPASSSMSAFFEPMNVKILDENSDAGGAGFSDLPTMFSHFFDTDLDGTSYKSTDFSETLEIEYPMSSKKYGFQAPPEWGLRTSPGEIQVALIELVIAESNLELALADYSGLMGEINYSIEVLNARSELQDEELKIGDDAYSQVQSFNERIANRNRAAGSLEVGADAAWNLGVAIAGGLPTSVGLANDMSFAGRGAALIVGQLANITMRGGAVECQYEAETIASDKELAQYITDTNLQKAGYKYDIQEQLKEIEGLLGNEAPTRLAIFKAREEMRQVSEKYRSVLAKGLRLLEERKAFNAEVAAKTQGKRYMDMSFRLNLNDALSKYRSMFDLASRYAYLCAKVYDYETNLNDRDSASAKPVLTDIIRQRSLGQYEGGKWVIGRGGLGDILAWMKTNYDSLKGQMGFNNPQTETGRFSLRKELFRIKSDEENDGVWKEELKKKTVENLWSIPEFKKYCRPFASEKMGAQKGIVIDFQTTISFGKNFFCWPLGGGDHAYDPSNYVTKVRSVGLWFDGYDNSSLSETPRAYLIPVGMDIMMVPNSDELDTREWTIIDQKLPVPLPVRDSDLNNPDWIPGLDSLNGSMIQIRRYSSFRAYHDSGYFDVNQVNYDSRLVGRSVWNSRWMLIIPAGTFHYDQDFALETFIDTIKDIKLFFQTYAISGN
ncbi:MAG: LamG domain-containing protein [Candidatus Magnetomorum sp.]|nr:LamG domain-containing protein [Candidatus Magnetomorum sp.]